MESLNSFSLTPPPPKTGMPIGLVVFVLLLVAGAVWWIMNRVPSIRMAAPAVMTAPSPAPALMAPRAAPASRASPAPAPASRASPAPAPASRASPAPAPVVMAPRASPAPAPTVMAAPAPVPPPTDPRQLVWSTGQKIQSEPLDISKYTNATEFKTKPTGYATQTTPMYTISFDVYVSATQTNWNAIFTHGALDNWDGAKPKPNGRLPFVEFYKNSTRLLVEHAGKQGSTITRHHASSAQGLPTNQWVNITISVNNGTATVYRNGSTEASFTGKFYWPDAANDKWYWAPSGPLTGTVKVANFYFWTSALSPSQIGILRVPTVPTAGVPTTSYYEVEPYYK